MIERYSSEEGICCMAQDYGIDGKLSGLDQIDGDVGCGD
jgi:hypothetical protein